MKIYGLQKMTLLDYPGRIACTVFLSGCDMRCPFCHNSELAEGKSPAVMDSEELLAFLKKRRGMLEGVAVTGGEPLLREETLALLREIRSLDYDIKLDTNGTHPDRLRKVLAENLAQYVAMDIKNSPARYAETAGLPRFDLTPVRESVRLLMEGGTDYEFRTTVVKELHSETDFAEIGRWIKGAKHYYLQSYRASDQEISDEPFSPPGQELLDAAVAAVKPFVQEVSLRG